MTKCQWWELCLKPGWAINLKWNIDQVRKNIIKKLGNS